LSSLGSIRSPEHLVPGAALVSSQQLQAPAGHLALVLNHTVKHRSSDHSPSIASFQLSAILRKPSPGKLAAAPNPIDGQVLTRFPAGSFFGGFRTPAPLPQPPLAPGRHPKPLTIPDARKGGLWLANSTPIADLRRDEYITAMCRKPTMSELSFVRAVIA
jgi:hypothetical protein